LLDGEDLAKYRHHVQGIRELLVKTRARKAAKADDSGTS
jgi:hypothetical protein